MADESNQGSVLDAVDDVAAEAAKPVIEEAASGYGPPEAPPVLLDKRRAYGLVQPPQGRQHYQQDGQYFDHAGQLVVEE